MKLKTTRTITTQECPWLEADIPAGTTVYRYEGCTYGCIGPGGRAVTAQEGKEPFFEIPRDAVSK